MREIILDTETTGLDPNNGHRIMDIGCVELIDHVPTGKVFQAYVNPERDVPKDVERICGLPTEFFFDKPKFREIADDFLDFIQQDVLVIHNAQFDINFLNSELQRVGKRLLSLENTIDTLVMARKMFPGSPASLDALCKRFGVDISAREKHGALLDCWLLNDVYINLLGGKQSSLSFTSESTQTVSVDKVEVPKPKSKRTHRVFRITDAEKEAHKELLAKISDPMWKKF